MGTATSEAMSRRCRLSSLPVDFSHAQTPPPPPPAGTEGPRPPASSFLPARTIRHSDFPNGVQFLDQARKRVNEATLPAPPPRSWRHSVFFWRRFPRKNTAARRGRAAAESSGGGAQTSKLRRRAASGHRLLCLTPSTTAGIEDRSAVAEIAYVALRHHPMEGGAAAGTFGPIYLVT